MKTIVKFCALLLMFQAGTLMMPGKASAQYAEMNYQVFYDQLSPYGMWVDDPNYGYVWVPDAGPGFMPYGTHGHWVYTDYGWTWVSHYRWGWAPFHYGRWDFVPMYGWIWVPGQEWGPAWVTWRHCDGYYGWVPMGPGINIHISFGPQFYVPAEHWIFVRDVDFSRRDVDHYYVRRSENASILRKTAVINNIRKDNTRHTTYVAGPDRKEVQRITKRAVKVVPIKETTRPGAVSESQVQVYRPAPKKQANEVRPVPGKVNTRQEVKPVNRVYVNPKENNKSKVQPVDRHKQQPAHQAKPANKPRG